MEQTKPCLLVSKGGDVQCRRNHTSPTMGYAGGYASSGKHASCDTLKEASIDN